ncbi:hypothetical protein RIF29_35117 [Crotalaria pallida]
MSSKLSTMSLQRPPSASWSNLPLELMESILQKLTIMDYLECRKVCQSWRTMVYVSLSTKAKCPPKPQFPLLLSLPTPPTNCPLTLLNLTQNKLHYLCGDVSMSNSGLRVSSVNGWLIFQKFCYEPSSRESHVLIWFYNPVSNAKIILPRLPLFPKYDIEHQKYGPSKVVISSLPDSPDSLVAYFVSCLCDGGLEQQVSFCKIANKPWTQIAETGEFFTDIEFRGCKLYAMINDDRMFDRSNYDFMVVINLGDCNAVTSERVMAFLDRDLCFNPKRNFRYNNNTKHHYYSKEKRFLVRDSTSGDLLLVLHLAEYMRKPGCNNYYLHSTNGFRVFKLDAIGGLSWSMIDSFSDRFLLFDASGVQVVSSTNIVGPWKPIRDNCIYFSLSNVFPNSRFPEHNIGVYSLTHDSITNFHSNFLSQVSSRNLWFIPSL